MAKYKGKHVTVDSIVRGSEDHFMITLLDGEVKRVSVSELTFTPEEKTKLINEDAKFLKDNPSVYKTFEDVDKEVELNKKNKLEKDNLAYDRLNPLAEKSAETKQAEAKTEAKHLEDKRLEANKLANKQSQVGYDPRPLAPRQFSHTPVEVKH